MHQFGIIKSALILLMHGTNMKHIYCLHRQFGDGDSVFLKNGGNHSPVYTTLQLEVTNRKTPFLTFTGLILFFMWQQPLVGQGLLIIEASRSHSDTPQSVGLLWMRDQSDAKTLPDNTRHSQETDIHVPVKFEPRILSSEWPQTHALEPAATGSGSLT